MQAFKQSYKPVGPSSRSYTLLSDRSNIEAAQAFAHSIGDAEAEARCLLPLLVLAPRFGGGQRLEQQTVALLPNITNPGLRGLVSLNLSQLMHNQGQEGVARGVALVDEAMEGELNSPISIGLSQRLQVQRWKLVYRQGRRADAMEQFQFLADQGGLRPESEGELQMILAAYGPDRSQANHRAQRALGPGPWEFPNSKPLWQLLPSRRHAAPCPHHLRSYHGQCPTTHGLETAGMGTGRHPHLVGQPGGCGGSHPPGPPADGRNRP